MFSKLFEERDKKISLLIKLGDCLGRSLRENISLFSIDSQSQLVTYLTENDKVISGNYKIDENISLNNIKVQDSSVFEHDEIFDTFVNEKIHSFVESIHYSEYSSAENSFSEVLSLWENRLKLGSLRGKLSEKANRLAEIENIVEGDSFQKLLDVTPQLITFLEENLEKISAVPEIKNAVNLSNAVATAFNFPRLTIEELEENSSYQLKNGVNESIYEMICRQELVKKELIESKKDFDVVWADNASIRHLAGMIFEDDQSIVESLGAALKDVPYLALASKRSLFETFNKCFANADGLGVTENDIQKYSSKIFEIKKDAKEMFIESINEKYGVNIQNLQEPTSFKSLVNTQIVIFETLSRLAPKVGILKDVLSEMSQHLKGKNGVQGIDVNDYIYGIFESAGYTELLEKSETLGKYTKVDFKRVASDLGGIKDVINSLKDKVAEKDAEYPSDETIDQESPAAAAPQEPTSAETPTEEPAPAAEAEPEAANDVDPVTSQDEIMSDLGNLENMVADIAAEITGATKEEEK